MGTYDLSPLMFWLHLIGFLLCWDVTVVFGLAVGDFNVAGILALCTILVFSPSRLETRQWWSWVVSSHLLMHCLHRWLMCVFVYYRVRILAMFWRKKKQIHDFHIFVCNIYNGIGFQKRGLVNHLSIFFNMLFLTLDFNFRFFISIIFFSSYLSDVYSLYQRFDNYSIFT